MFRLASLLGMACLALAACVLAGTPTKTSEELPPEQTNNPQNSLRTHLPRILASGYHAQFSVN